jgi:hypothetical protein
MRRPDPFERPLDRTLLHLRKLWPGEQVYRWHPDKIDDWVARCPICRISSVFTLEITEMPLLVGGAEEPGGEVRFDCWTGCDERLIRLTLGIDHVVTRAYKSPSLRAAA